MQLLVYIFIFLIGIGVGLGAYFGLTFTPIESLLFGVLAIIFSITMFERTLRRRSLERLERGIEELSRLLSTNAQAGQVLSKRVNKLSDMKIDKRLETIEADLSVLGTVTRQVAEAVAQLEAAREKEEKNNQQISYDLQEEDAKPTISVEDITKALDDGRIIVCARPIISLPKREVKAYDIVTQMQFENGEMKKIEDLIFSNESENIARTIDQLGLKKLFNYLENNKDTKGLVPIHVPISNATLSDNAIIEWIIAQLDVSRELASYVCFAVSQKQFDNLDGKQQINLNSLVEKGAAISIKDVSNLRMDFASLKNSEVSSVRADATIFTENTQKLTDYQSSDVAAYIARFGIDLIVSGVKNEEQLLLLLEDGVGLICGDHVSPAKPASEIIKNFDDKALNIG